MANEIPSVYVAVYRGPEDGTNIPYDPYLKKMDPIEEAIFKTKEMAVARGEFELKKAQKVVHKHSLRHSLQRIEIGNDEGKIIMLRDSRAGIYQEKTITKKVSLQITFGENPSIEMTSELESYSNLPWHFGRAMSFYNS